MLQVKDNDYEEQGMPQQAPPSYDAAVNGDRSALPLPRFRISQLTTVVGAAPGYYPESASKGRDVKVPPSLPQTSSYQQAGPSMPPTGQTQPGGTVVYNYINPSTGERVVSLLPPDHPQMVCLQEGRHVPASKFGFLGE